MLFVGRTTLGMLTDTIFMGNGFFEGEGTNFRVSVCTTTISLKRVKIEEKLLWRAYRNSPTLFRTVPSPTLYGLPFPKIGGSQPPPKTPIALISGTAFKFGQYIHRVHQKIIRNFGEKGAWTYSATPKIFWVPLLSQERVKLRTSNLAGPFTVSIRTKAH